MNASQEDLAKLLAPINILPKGFRVEFPLAKRASLETMHETMFIFFGDDLNNLGIQKTYDIGETVRIGYVHCEPNHPDAFRVSLFRFKRPYRYIDDGALADLRMQWFQILSEHLLYKKREWLPHPYVRPIVRPWVSTSANL